MSGQVIARLDELERRMVELEARLPKPIPVVTPVMNQDGLSERTLQSLWDGPYPRRMTAEESRPANQQPSPEHARMMQIASMMRPQPSYEQRMLNEACELLKRSPAYTGWSSELRQVYREDIEDFLARARVATKDP